MADLDRIFRRRFSALLALLIVSVAASVAVAFVTARNANRTLRQLANIELEAAQLAREFRGEVDDIHGALLRIGSDAAEDSTVVIRERRQKLNDWLATRLKAAHSKEEIEILRHLADEVRSYLIKLDGVAARPGGFTTPLDRDAVVMFDDSANRLQSMADDFSAVHDADLRDLLETSLREVGWMRNLVFGCLALLVGAIGVVVTLLYREVVHPLRARLYESETLLAQREKLAALGTLAAGVAHEIRNPLTAVKARLYTLRRGITTPDAKEDVQAIAQEIDRLEGIVRDVLGYARPADPKVQPVELSVWLRDLAEFIRPELEDKGATLAVEMAGAPRAVVDPDQLRQVMLNLIRNAQEAFNGQPGKIGIELRSEAGQLRGRRTEIVVLSVTDDGPGIPLAVQSRLFDPFFTTKASGTGLGLSIVARLVEQNGGEITFQSAPEAGTRFSVRLPAAGAEPKSSRP
jgi:signal transduction histidine kinase